MAAWDVFHSDRLELVRGLSADQIAAGLASGEIRDDDLARPAGTNTPWARIADLPELIQPPRQTVQAPLDETKTVEMPAPISVPVPIQEWPVDDDDDDEEDDEEEEIEPPAEVERIVPAWELTEDDLGRDRATRQSSSSRVALPVVASRDYGDRPEFDEEDEEETDEAPVSLTRAGPARVEELDLAAMVDVAFQLVLFFLVTATTILYKTLEIPKPSTEPPPDAVAQGRQRTLDELQEDFILVEIDAEGNVQIDREPVATDMAALTERLRSARETTGRTTMLLSADFTTHHRDAVLAYDAANDIGLAIAIAKPQAPQGPPPAFAPGQPAAKQAGAGEPAPTS